MKTSSILSTLVALPLAWGSATYTTNGTYNFSNLTVALVRAPPANWPSPFWNKNWTDTNLDLNATVEKGVSLISQAASDGANLVIFPELWFAGYPKGIDASWLSSDHASSYIANSLAIGSTHWQTLLAAAAEHRVYVALAFSELTNSSIYMGQSLVAPNGTVLISRRKLRPSGVERSFWSDGDTDGLKVVETPFGRWGILECWEHFHPSMTFAMQAQLEDLHIASFPYMPSANDPSALSWESLEVNSAAARTYAVNSGAVTLFAAVGYSAVYDGEGVEIAVVEADVDFDAQPLLYASINATAFKTQPYNVDGEQSWGVLEQIREEWPAYIPKVQGEFTLKNTVLVEDVLANITH